MLRRGGPPGEFPLGDVLGNADGTADGAFRLVKIVRGDVEPSGLAGVRFADPVFGCKASSIRSGFGIGFLKGHKIFRVDQVKVKVSIYRTVRGGLNSEDLEHLFGPDLTVLGEIDVPCTVIADTSRQLQPCF